MSENKETPTDNNIDFILPTEDFLYDSLTLEYVLCKPKLLPLKSVTLEKLEKMQRDAEEKIRAAREREQKLETTEEEAEEQETGDE